MKILLAIVVLLALGTAVQAGALQLPAHRVVSPSSRYWLSNDLNRLVFWKVRTAPAEAASR